MVESGCAESGHRPRPPHRPAERGQRLPPLHERYHRRAHPCPPGKEVRTRRRDPKRRGNRPGADKQRGSAGAAEEVRDNLKIFTVLSINILRRR